MRILRLLFPLLLVLALHGVEPPFLGDSRPARNIEVGKTTLFSLTPENTEIIVAANASSMTRMAAVELNSLLKKRFGQDIPQATIPTDGKKSIILGVNELSQAAGIDASVLCLDAFIIRTVNEKIYILGRDDAEFNPEPQMKRVNGWQFSREKGTLFGVYDFLSRFGGMRFYFADAGTLIGSGPIKVPEINIFDRPDLEMRNVQPYEGVWFDGKGKAGFNKPYSYTDGGGVAERNMDMFRFRLGTKKVSFTHGLAQLGYYRRFGESHPEYFAMDKDGNRITRKTRTAWHEQFCYSNAAEPLYQDISSCLRNEPPTLRKVTDSFGNTIWSPMAAIPGQVFNLMPGDNFFRCQCEKCRPHMTDEQSVSQFYWNFVNQIAWRLKADGISGYLTANAYVPYHLPPETLADNLYIMCHSNGPWMIHSQDQLSRVEENLQAWQRLSEKKVVLWSYANKWGDQAFPGIPAVTPRAYGKYYKMMAPHIFGAFVESETDNYVCNLPNYYMFGRIAWDTSCDPEAILKEYCRDLFGQGASSMEKIFNIFEEKWLSGVLNRVIETPLGPSYIVASAHEVWTKIYSQAECNKIVALFDAAEKAAKEDIQASERIRLFRKSILNPLLDKSREYAQRNATIPLFAVNAGSPIYLQRMDGKTPERSEFNIELAGENLKITFELSESEITRVQAHKRPDNDSGIWKDNGVEILLNPSGDRLNYYHYIINSVGSVFGRKLQRSGTSRIIDEAWRNRAVVKVENKVDSWGGELLIPLNSLELSKEMERLVINFCRHQVKNGTSVYYSWSPFLNSSNGSPFHDLDNFGTVRFGKIQKNLIADGDFRQNQGSTSNTFGGWTHPVKLREKTTVEYDYDSFVCGDKSLKLTSWGNTVSIRQSLPDIVAGKKYRLTYFIKLTNVKPISKYGGAVINIHDDHNRWFPSNRLIGTTGWFAQSFEFTAGPNTKNDYMILYLLEASGTVNFDSISLIELE